MAKVEGVRRVVARSGGRCTCLECSAPWPASARCSPPWRGRGPAQTRRRRRGPMGVRGRAGASRSAFRRRGAGPARAWRPVRAGRTWASRTVAASTRSISHFCAFAKEFRPWLRMDPRHARACEGSRARSGTSCSCGRPRSGFRPAPSSTAAARPPRTGSAGSRPTASRRELAVARAESDRSHRAGPAAGVPPLTGEPRKATFSTVMKCVVMTVPLASSGCIDRQDLPC